MTRVGLAAALVTIVAAIVYLKNHRSTATPAALSTVSQPSTNSADCSQCARLAAQIDALQRDLTAMKSQLAAQQAQSPGRMRDANSNPPARDDPRDVEATRAADAEQHRAYMSGIEQRFTAEKAGGGWADNASSRIGGELEQDEVLRQFGHNVECRQQTCRVEISDDGRVSARIPMVALKLADVFPSISAEQVGTGKGKTLVLYMSSQQTAPSAVSR